MRITRRELIERTAYSGAALSLAHAIGAAPACAAEAAPRDPSIGRGRKVIVLGAGMAGLVSAYELVQAGFDVTVLEARDRVGGRNWTVRGGDVVRHAHGPAQSVAFDEGFYFNCGPARLPSHHTTILDYCKELGVALEVEVNTSRHAYVATADGKRIRLSQLVHDTRGYAAELVVKGLDRGAFNSDVPEGERANAKTFLTHWGDLDPETFAYRGSERAGYVTPPGAAHDGGEHLPAIPRADLFQPHYITAAIYDEEYDMQPTMFQPVGGMDHIPKAFAHALGDRIRLNCEVRGLRNRSDGVDIAWREAGHTRTAHADYVVCTLPAPLLTRVSTNFTTSCANALRAVRLDYATKLAFQAPRFWETEDRIYGGISYLEHNSRLLWYPSSGLFSNEGVLLACYNAGLQAQALTQQSIEARIASGRAAVEMAHPGKSALLKNPVSIAWHDMPYNEGPWALLGGQGQVYDRLNEPEGRVHLAGDWLSKVSGWQEGAAASARRAVAMIAQRAVAANG